MEKLKSVKNDIPTILWCGPAAISAVTGEKVSVIVATMKRLSGRRCIKGVSTGLMMRTLTLLGWEAVTLHKFDSEKIHTPEERVGYGIMISAGMTTKYVPWKKRPTLARYTRQNRADFQEHACIVETTQHYVAVFGRRFCDNYTKEPVFLKQSPHRRARVQKVLQIKKVGGPNWKPAPRS